MDADAGLTAAQSGWFTAQVVLLAVGIVGVVVGVRRKTNVSILATTSLVVNAAELVAGIAFPTTRGRRDERAAAAALFSGEVRDALSLSYRGSSVHCFTTHRNDRGESTSRLPVNAAGAGLARSHADGFVV